MTYPDKEVRYEIIIRILRRHLHVTWRLLSVRSAPPVEEEHPIGVWGQRRLNYLKHRCKVLYYNLLTSGKLHSHLADIEKQAQDLFSRLVKQYAEKEGITERLKAANQMAWVQKMNNIRERVIETVCSGVVFI